MTQTFSQHKNKVASSKVILAHVEPSQRLLLWTLDSGAIYTRSVDHYAIDVKQDTTSLTEASSSSLSAGEWFFDAENKVLYIRLSDDSNPEDSYITGTYRLFFSDAGLNLPHDLTTTGNEVYYESLIRKTSSFKSEVDSADQFGISLEGKGSIDLENSHGFFDSIFDKIQFENKQVSIYAWSKDLPVDQSQIIYKGKIQDKTFSSKSVSFKLKDFISDLKGLVNTGTFSSSDGTIADSIIGKPKRILYGRNIGVQTQSVDMIADGYDLSGTITLTADSTTVTGSGTSFLSELSPGDEIIYTDILGDEQSVGVKSITSDTDLVLTDSAETTESAIAVTVRPSRPYRFANREQYICGHKLIAPSTTVDSNSDYKNRFDAVDASDFLVGFSVNVNGTASKIKRISGNTITLEQGLPTNPTAGQSVTTTPISNVYYNKKKLFPTRDYTVTNSTFCKLTLTDTAEFNIARTKDVAGTSVTFSNGSRDVTGIGTEFTEQIKPRDWIKSDDIGYTTWHEVLEVTDNTNLILRVAYAGANNTGDASRKNVELIDDDSIIVCDTLGKENESGDWVKSASDIVADLLSLSGITTIDTDEFSTADTEAPFIVAMKVPYGRDDSLPSYRDVISKINQSVFGSLVNNTSLVPTYRVLTPDKPNSMPILEDNDILSFSVSSKTDLKSDWLGRYAPFDSDKFNLGESGSSVLEYNSEYVSNVIGLTQREEVDIFLYELADARQILQRYAFFHELSQSVIRIKTKINTIDLSVGDKIQVDFNRLYKRKGDFGSRKKVGVISSIAKRSDGVELEVSDLGNIFNRAANIADDSSADFTSAPESEKIFNGYIVDDDLEIPDITSEAEWSVNLIS